VFKKGIVLAGLWAGLLLFAVLAGAGGGPLRAFPGVPEIAPAAATANPGEGQAGHGDPYTLIFYVFGLAIVVAVLGRFAATRLKQSPVLGEVVAGILMGALFYQLGSPVITLIRHADEVQQITQAVLEKNVGWEDAVRQYLGKADMPMEDAAQLEKTLLRGDIAQYYAAAEALQYFSRLGVVLLLFLVGLECNLAEMREVGGPAFGVAFIAISGIFLAAYLALSQVLLPQASSLTALFLAASLTATSIGISARVFKDMNCLGRSEAKLVLGAAVVDDILGLVLLAVITGLAVEGAIRLADVALILFKAVVFLGGVLLVGALLLNRMVGLFRVLDRGNVRLIFPFVLLMFLTWLAEEFGLAAIIGAFGAGLILEEKCFPGDPACNFEGQPVEAVVAPIQLLFAPIFFVLIGFKVDLSTFANARVLLTSLALVLIVAGGKLLATLALRRGENRLVVAAGMLPGGEVMLIFASLGKSLGLLDGNLYAMIIIVMLINTLMAPSLLKFFIERQRLREATSGA
jgi:Kef-type K+ transport system membrane component KefB